ncbi:MAG: EAL domain-containing protein [Yoonia sp.]|nr:EAL domain-containing protein [Yoonia sp.]
MLQYIDQCGIQPSNLRIELLESTLLDERSVTIVKNVQHLISLGFAVELDDFGTGHAAIATLRKFDVSRIKIDRSLVENIDSEPELREITGAIINLAERLNIQALAEGVETQDEQATLNELGCSVAQGYLHARPMPLMQLRAWIRDWQTSVAT